MILDYLKRLFTTRKDHDGGELRRRLTPAWVQKWSGMRKTIENLQDDNDDLQTTIVTLREKLRQAQAVRP